MDDPAAVENDAIPNGLLFATERTGRVVPDGQRVERCALARLAPARRSGAGSCSGAEKSQTIPPSDGLPLRRGSVPSRARTSAGRRVAARALVPGERDGGGRGRGRHSRRRRGARRAECRRSPSSRSTAGGSDGARTAPTVRRRATGARAGRRAEHERAAGVGGRCAPTSASARRRATMDRRTHPRHQHAAGSPPRREPLAVRGRTIEVRDGTDRRARARRRRPGHRARRRARHSPRRHALRTFHSRRRAASRPAAARIRRSCRRLPRSLAYRLMQRKSPYAARPATFITTLVAARPDAQAVGNPFAGHTYQPGIDVLRLRHPHRAARHGRVHSWRRHGHRARARRASTRSGSISSIELDGARHRGERSAPWDRCMRTIASRCRSAA